MIDKYLQIETLSIVFLGDFNPVIIQPSWLSSRGLIREEEATNARIEIIHNEVVRFEIDGWMKFESTRSRCEFKTSKAPYFDPLKDLASGVFKILCETPIKSLGLNFVYDLSLSDKKMYYEFGNNLTPLTFWKDSLNDPRLLQLEIYEEKRVENSSASRRVRIAPTDQKISFGIMISVNNHFDFSQGNGTSNPITFLENNIDNLSKESKEIVIQLFNKMNI